MIALAVGPLPSPGRAQEATSPPPQAQPAQGELDLAREHIKAADYDNAIELLSAATDSLRALEGANPRDLEILRDAYLLLVKSWVQLGKSEEEQPQGRQNARKAYQEAERLVAECLSIKPLRDTRPQAGPEYPDRMIQLFERVRGETLGAFTVTRLVPPSAVVTLDADTLRAAEPDTLPGDAHVAVGKHDVVVSAPGYKSVAEVIEIAPSATVLRDYELARRRSRTWWATRAAGVLAIGGILAVIFGGSSNPELPPAPDPPQ